MLSSKRLDRHEKIHLESICSAAIDDYAEEIEDLSVYKLCEWFQEKVEKEMGLILENVGIDLELKLEV